MILGVDTGGTFTDFALYSHSAELRTHKVLSTPDSPERAILQGIQEMGLATMVASGKLKIIHGSTVATNAVLEGKGAKTAYITNKGFKDMLSIGRQTRPHLYHLESPPQTSPVPPKLCLEISGRIDASGNILEPLDQIALQELVLQLETLKPEAIAINLLFSFLDESHEETLAQLLQQHLSWQPFISRSTQVLPEYKEYERGIATWLNASLGPLVRDYLLKLKAGTEPSPVSVMQSSGGTISAEQAAEKSVNLLLSGPAGGLAAASFLARKLNQPRLMTFDMGGTSTDVALITDGEIILSNEGKIGKFPVSVPMVDMHTIGAGGGSIAYIDEGNLLKVGPQSAGAKPGPACYGLGGKSATVSDANLVLGRLLPEAFMGGNFNLDIAAATSSIAEIALKLALTINECANGIITIANEHMARALRVISIERGYDPKEFRLCCFGGAGGLHICALAEALEMKQAMVPRHAGVFSAVGMYLAPIERQLSITHQGLLNSFSFTDIYPVLEKLKSQAVQQIQLELMDNTAELTTEFSADIRYLGQSSCLNLQLLPFDSLEERFQQLHNARYGHRLSTRVELVNIRVVTRVQVSDPSLSNLPSGGVSKPDTMIELYGYSGPIPVYQRHQLGAGQLILGPALITEKNSTTLLEINWEALVDEYGNLLLQQN